MQTFKNYDEALQSCSGSFDESYQDVIDYTFQQTLILREQIRQDNYLEKNKIPTSVLQEMAAILYVNRGKEMRIIELGGSFGASYFMISELLNSQLVFDWNILETPDVTQKAHKLEEDGLHFYSDPESLFIKKKEIDLIIASGVLQYIKNYKSYLNSILDAETNFIFLNKLSLCKEDEDRFITHTYSLKESGFSFHDARDIEKIYVSPHISMTENTYRNLLLEKFEVVYEFENLDGLIELDNENLIGMGGLYKRR